MIRRAPRSPLFPSTTLFRSDPHHLVAHGVLAQGGAVERHVEAGLVRRREARPGREDQPEGRAVGRELDGDRKSSRLTSSHANFSYVVFCLQKNPYIILSRSC